MYSTNPSSEFTVNSYPRGSLSLLFYNECIAQLGRVAEISSDSRGFESLYPCRIILCEYASRET